MLRTEDIISKGLTFERLRCAMAWIYFGFEGMTQDQWREALRYVLPMQHNIVNPITLKEEKDGAVRDTYIEYWIDDDDRLTRDVQGAQTYQEEGSDRVFMTNECQKVARVTLRFIGAHGEAWAKLFHHINQRPEVMRVFGEYCNANMLEYVGPIRPINVDYFGVQNTAVAYDIVLMLQYVEVMKLPGERLGLISIASGNMTF